MFKSLINDALPGLLAVAGVTFALTGGMLGAVVGLAAVALAAHMHFDDDR